MFSPTINLLSVNGYRQNPDPKGQRLNDLLASDSGLYFNDVHPLLTINNLASVADMDYSYPLWAAGVYQIGDRVSFENRLFECIQATTNQATTDEEYWEEIDQFTEWLSNKTQGYINMALNRWATERIVFNNAKRVMSAGVIPKFSKTQTTLQGDNWMGYEIMPMGKGRAVTIHKVGLHFAANTTVSLKVFRADVADPIYSKDITYTNAGSVQWEDFPIMMDKALPYYVVYDASGKSPIDSVDQVIARFPIRSVKTKEDVLGQMWDLDTNEYSSTSNYGLFLDYAYGCDLTDFIVQNKLSFASYLQLFVGAELLRELAMNANARVNRNETNIDIQTLLYEIDGDSRGRPGGIGYKLNRAFKALRLDMSGIDKICLGCKKGPKYTAI